MTYALPFTKACVTPEKVNDRRLLDRAQSTTLFVLIYLFLELMKISKNSVCYFDTIIRYNHINLDIKE